MEKAIRLNPHGLVWSWWILGKAYRLTGRVEEAIATLKKLLSRYPNVLHAHLGLAIAYSELGQEEEARAEAVEILRISPNFSVEEFRQGNAYADRARLERFVANLRKAGLK